MKIADLISVLEALAPPALQESYDNCGLITGSRHWNCTGVMICLDATPEVVEEAVQKGCNLVVAHHPILFKGVKSITGKNYVEQSLITAIKHDVALYAIHTNLDNVITGVNHRIASRIGLVNTRILWPKQELLCKLYTFVPATHLNKVRQALFEAGAGHIGNYSECSFSAPGTGTFKGGPGSHPFLGTPGIRQEEPEVKLEMILPFWMAPKVVAALKNAHPYEEVAYDLVALQNEYQLTGSGLLGELPEPMAEEDFLRLLQNQFHLRVVRHTPLLGKPLKTIAICGGAGSFLTARALAAGAHCFVTADIKYHEFFDAENKLVLADIGHFESEQFTIDLLFEELQSKFPTFAVLKTTVLTNPVRYFVD